MTIENFYTSTFTRKELVYTGNNSDYVKGDGFTGHIQQARPDVIQFFEGKFNLTHIVWCPVDTVINETDKITLNGIDYTVRTIQKNNVGDNEHLEVYVEEGK
jgi:hypothetical protein